MITDKGYNNAFQLNELLCFSYLRLSKEEAQRGESTSIENQRLIVNDFCARNGIILVGEFVDDGYSGSNFKRPDFQSMLKQLSLCKANAVITKDLSRLGRDMVESSYYAEQYFPEHNIRYIAIHDNFDNEQENVMAPFQFAMNDVYIRDCSRKIKNVLKSKREHGQYCACPPYGYRKDKNDKHRLVPDEVTAPIVKRIFTQAANGDSSRKIAIDLNTDSIIPPLKYRVLYRDEFGEKGASRASDIWNYTTVKRILKNQVYLGHTVLGKTRKASIKSTKKIAIDEEKWCITHNTHEPLVTQDIFETAQKNLGKGTKKYEGYGEVRKSIFGGLVFCEKCGHALCSAGTVYKGEREKYWYLSCTHRRKNVQKPCEGVRIRYEDLLELVKEDINQFISLTNDDINEIVDRVTAKLDYEQNKKNKNIRIEKAQIRLNTISKVISKLYTDNVEGLISDEQLVSMVKELQTESSVLKNEINELNREDDADKLVDNYRRFFDMAKQFAHIDELDRDILLSFVDRIEVGDKELPDGVSCVTHRNQPYKQKVRIHYKFINETGQNPVRAFGA